MTASILPIYCFPTYLDKKLMSRLSLGEKTIVFEAITSGENEILVFPKSTIFPSNFDNVCLFLLELNVTFVFIKKNSESLIIASASIPIL